MQKGLRATSLESFFRPIVKYETNAELYWSCIGFTLVADSRIAEYYFHVRLHASHLDTSRNATSSKTIAFLKGIAVETSKIE